MHPSALTRRELLVLSSLGLAGLTQRTPVFAQSGDKPGTLASLNRFPRMMQDYLGARVAAAQKLVVDLSSDVRFE
ncbi:MAG: hypothetical protein JWP89_1849 [Schlesneria sp.]|nr:hypothetical protein [Schlesneria sp.]